MKDFLKLFPLLLSVGFVNVCAFCMVASLFLKQFDGVFWYGIGLIVFGVSLKTMVKKTAARALLLSPRIERPKEEEIPMKLTGEQKKEYFELLWDMTQKSYSPAQTPSREKFQRVVDEGDVFVLGMSLHAAVPSDIVGYALVSPLLYPVILRSIVVLERYRGLGLGAVLLTEVANFYRAAGYSRIVLHVMVHNPAQKLYFDAGYRVMKVLQNYYAPEGDGLEMEKIL